MPRVEELFSDQVYWVDCRRRRGSKGGLLVACLVPVEILVNLVEILVDLVVDGVKWRKIYAVPIGYRLFAQSS